MYITTEAKVKLQPDKEELWNHFICQILALDRDNSNILKKGGIKRMNHIFQYTTNLENFDDRFPDNSPTIVNVRYFIIHFHVHDYKINNKELMA